MTFETSIFSDPQQPDDAGSVAASAIDDPFLDDDETEEILRDVVVGEAMRWTERGADPTDLAQLLVATGNLRAWQAAHPTCGVCGEGHDDLNHPE